VREVNALHAAAHAEPPDARGVIDSRLAEAFVRAQQAVGVPRPARPARTKRTIADAYFRAAGVEGMTNPFFLETLVVSSLLPIERPAVVAHEWSHLAGLADEGEASFLGWLTCLRGPAAARYSGWLFLYREVAAALGAEDRQALASGLDDGPRADLAAIAARMRRDVRPTVSAVGWRAYDGYLKANRVEAGTESYRDVVRLALAAAGRGYY
jgi:hypothetical protein